MHDKSPVLIYKYFHFSGKYCMRTGLLFDPKIMFISESLFFVLLFDLSLGSFKHELDTVELVNL